MLKKYLQIAVRTFLKNRLYSFINVTGLAISLTASILLLLWVWDELSYDSFHAKASRIYATAAAFDKEKEKVWLASPAPLATSAKREVPAVEDACRVMDRQEVMIEYGNKKLVETNTSYADASLFTMFNFPLVSGDKNKPFANGHSLVITETTAKKYFGNEPAIGKVVKLNDKENFTVSAVAKDPPQNSSHHFDVVLPMQVLAADYTQNPDGLTLESDWGNYNYITYLLVKPNTNIATLGKQLADVHRSHKNDEFVKDLFYILQPLTQMHLYLPTGQDSGAQVVHIFFLVAVIILLIACINYVNLVTARASRRAKEVSVRKVIGAARSQLFVQFIIESLLVFVIAAVISVVLVYLLIPVYNQLSGKSLVFRFYDAKVLALYGAVLLITVVLAGIYPAIILSSFNPAVALKGIVPRFGSHAGFRKVLVVVQFACSVILIVSTLIVGQQLSYIRQKNLGYNRENVFAFNGRNFAQHYSAIKAELEKIPGIQSVSASTGNIMQVQSSTGDVEWDGKTAAQANFMMNQMDIDRNLLQTLNLQLTSGDGFSGTPADSSHFLINETAVKAMGIENPVGKRLSFHNRQGVIAGVVKDFHFENMKSVIKPFIFSYQSYWRWWYMYVKTTGSGAPQAIAAVQKLWKQYNPDYNFEYKFLDESFDDMYRKDIRIGQLFNCFACIAIFISCFGLFGLVTYTAEAKVKEIGIRKTLGASLSHIILLLSKDLLKLVVVSFVIAFPLAWLGMNQWLANYAYRTSVQWWVFVLAGLAAFAIAFLTVSSKALNAAQNNPVQSLRTE